MIRSHLVLVSCTAAVLFGSPPPASGQATPTPGSLVRVYRVSSDVPVQGTLTGTSPAGWTVSLPDGSALRIPSTDIRSADVGTRRRNTLRGALVGGGVGLAVGLVVALTADDECSSFPSPGVCDAVVDAGVKGPALIVTPVAGAALGALVGTFITSTRWTPLLVPGGTGGGWGLTWRIPVGARR